MINGVITHTGDGGCQTSMTIFELFLPNKDLNAHTMKTL